MSRAETFDSARSVWEAITTCAGAREGRITFHLEDGEEELSLERLAEEGLPVAGFLAEHGVGPGDRVGLLGPNRPAWLRSALGVWAAGAALVPLPKPVHIPDRAAHAAAVERLARAAGCRVVLVDPEHGDLAGPDLALEWDRAGKGSPPEVAPAPEDPAVIQFTSGSTAAPRGARITHGAALHAMRVWARWNHTGPGDRIHAWLPLFHDWGLFGCVGAILAGAHRHLLPTERFARDPGLWLRLATEGEATYLEAPPSAWGVALRSRSKDRIDLSGVRRCVLAGEAVDPRLIDRLRERGAGIGLPPVSIGVAYGLAEATMGVTATRLDGPPRVDAVDPAALAGGTAEPNRGGRAKRIVSCGEPYAGLEVRIAGDGEVMGERSVGDVEVRGPSVMAGYEGSDEDPFVDGWLRTGDLGYLAGGELYVTGRSKDVIIVLGQNHAPEDLEWAASSVPGTRAGRCAAFASPGTEGVATLVVEPSPGTEPHSLPKEVRSAVYREVGALPLEVLVVAPGSVPKTSSGKLRRGALRDTWARDRLSILARD